ncbi:hypothetical protein DYB26_016300, partial [Aphanomyces astaci]
MIKTPEGQQLLIIDSLEAAADFLTRDPRPPRAMITGRIVFTERRDPASKVLNVFLVAVDDDGPLHELQALTRDVPGDLKRSNLKFLYTYGTAKSTGRPSNVSNAMHRRLIRAAHTGKYTAAELVERHSLPVGRRRVCQLLNKSGKLKYKKRLAAPMMTRAHE